MKIICIGRNYADHITELKNERPSEPIVFLKPDTSILLKKQPFFIPEFSNEVQHEVELLVKIKVLNPPITLIPTLLSKMLYFNSIGNSKYSID